MKIQLPLALIAALLPAVALAQGTLVQKQVTLSPAEAARRAPPPADPDAFRQALRQRVLAASNRARASVGLPPLVADPALSAAARRYSRKMRDYGFFDHVAPDGETLDQRVPASEDWRYSTLGENLWSAQGAIDWRAPVLASNAASDWVASPSHRENLFHPDYALAGVGTALAGDRLYITMLYAEPVEDLNRARLYRDHGKAPADLPGFAARLREALARGLNDARRRAGLASVAADPVLGRVATENAGRSLWQRSAAPGVLQAAFAADPARRGRLAAGFQRAEGSVIWQAEELAKTMVERWLAGTTAADLLDPGYAEFGIGIATDGTAIAATVLLGEGAARSFN